MRTKVGGRCHAAKKQKVVVEQVSEPSLCMNEKIPVKCLYESATCSIRNVHQYQLPPPVSIAIKSSTRGTMHYTLALGIMTLVSSRFVPASVVHTTPGIAVYRGSFDYVSEDDDTYAHYYLRLGDKPLLIVLHSMACSRLHNSTLLLEAASNLFCRRETHAKNKLKCNLREIVS